MVARIVLFDWLQQISDLGGDRLGGLGYCGVLPFALLYAILTRHSGKRGNGHVNKTSILETKSYCSQSTNSATTTLMIHPQPPPRRAGKKPIHLPKKSILS